MALFDSLFGMFFDHVAVVGDNPESLKKEVEIVQHKCGPTFRVRGFIDVKQFFLALHVAKAKHRPFSLAFIKEDEDGAVDLVLHKSAPDIKTLNYSDAQTLATLLLSQR